MRFYGKWAGNERGVKENPAKCVASVTPSGRVISQQCSRKRVAGPEGLYCRQHAKHIEDGRHVWAPDDEARASDEVSA